MESEIQSTPMVTPVYCMKHMFVDASLDVCVMTASQGVSAYRLAQHADLPG